MEKIYKYTYCYTCNSLFNGIADDYICPACYSEAVQMGIAQALIYYILNDKED